ncbi:CD44 antigen isoform X1 [Xenopus tropicalis]|uniref:CD44 antigen n=1 Tax=Xenopus tropicalis TaxID=8364 RepID=A0A6I8RHB9_XENTR|nr:CD44 antigen isoform X1 [Xenopus tropicalis]
MAQLLWIVTGFCCLLSACQARTVISCRFKGVFHVEKYDRYALNREDAIKLCHELNTTIANLTLMEIAQDIGFETCRYGWIEDRVVIPRIKPNPICAANYTGIFTLGNNDSLRYDAYCYNASETEDKSCEPVLLLNETDLSHKTIDSYDPTLDGEHGKNPNKGRKIQPGESENDITKQRRAARVPDWLIVLVALVALGLILSVCLAINTRRLCGQKKKLVINGNKTKLEDGEIMEQNGDNIKSQEMVQLVSQEHTVEQENHMTTEDIKRNEKDIDMKIGV